MKTVTITIVVLALLGLLAWTNPSMDAYQAYLQQRIQDRASKHGALGAAFGALIGGAGSKLMAKATVRDDYVFFSTYQTTLGGSTQKTLGVLNNFYVLSSPPGSEPAPADR